MNKNYIIIGDSIAYGIGDYETLGWATMFKKNIMSKDNTYVCNNFAHIVGYPGATSFEVLERIDAVYAALMYNGFENNVILAIGINDVFEYAESGRNTIDEYISNIKNISNFIKKQGAKLIIVGLTLTDDNDINQLILDYDNSLREFCESKEINYIPMLDLFTEDDLIDGLHPNKEGYKNMFDRIKKYIQI